jgi:glycosyltransferase involved in cell wall biosynthesis
MPSTPLISVVVPTYNRAALIGETIHSILAQSFHNFELLVVSDGSTDHTETVVTSYRDPRIRLVKQSNSGGPARPRNTGVENSRGKYVAFCDDDDLWMPEKLEKQVGLMEQQPNTGLCFTRGVTFGDVDFFSKWTFKNGNRTNHFRSLLYGNFIANSSVLVRRSVLAEVGAFNTEKFLHGVEDYEMWLRIAYRHKLAWLNEPLIKYRIQSGGLGANRSRGTLKTMRIVRDFGQKNTLGRGVFLPLTWQCFKFTIYSIARR